MRDMPPRDDPRVASVSGESCEGVLERRGSEVLFYDRGVHGHPPLGIRVGAGNSQTVESGPIRATRRAGVYRSARQRVKISHQLKISVTEGGVVDQKSRLPNSIQEGPVTRASLREYAAVQRERYLRATRAEKRQLLDEIVAVAGARQPFACFSISLLGRPQDAKAVS